MTYLIVVVLLCVLGVSGAFEAIYEFCSSSQYTYQQSKLKYRLKRPRNTQNAQEHNDNEVSHLYFIIWTIFKQFTKSS